MGEVIIPEKEITIIFSRSGGKGGQNVNKVETKATLKWDVYNTNILTPEQKFLLLHKLANKINDKGEVVLWSQSERSQIQNKEEVIRKLNYLLNQALAPIKHRRATKPTKNSREKRLQSKKHLSQKKLLRKNIY